MGFAASSWLKIDQMPALRELSIIEIPVTDVAAQALVLQAQKALRMTLLRSVASRPQSVAKTMGAHVCSCTRSW